MKVQSLKNHTIRRIKAGGLRDPEAELLLLGCDGPPGPFCLFGWCYSAPCLHDDSGSAGGCTVPG
uniref:Uncharacterized protein n=1 Tax=Anguilla anguilla TaxID=7936 RepID=A0A0E9WGG1_ANGAN